MFANLLAPHNPHIMNPKKHPSYAALGNTSARTESQQSLLEKFTSWFRDFLENAE